jgi:DNA adenine methylase
MLSFHDKSQCAVFDLADFKTTMEKATIGSVVYCDPPYAPLTATANFSDYTKEGFSLTHQHALADCAKKLIARGVPVVISNHDTEFTRSIYSEAQITSFEVQRFISSDTSNRNKAAELLALYD